MTTLGPFIAELPLGDALVLAGPEPMPLFVLNPAAQCIWRGLAAGRPEREVASELRDYGDLPLSEARAHVAEAAAAWHAAGLLDGALPRAVPPAAATARAGGNATGGRVYTLCGTPVAIRFAPDLADLLHPRLGHSETPDAQPEAELVVTRDGEGFLLSGDGGPTLHAPSEQALLGRLTQRLVEISHRRSDWLAVLHAAGVARADGAILLAGRNGCGKSLLTLALHDDGYSYLSDDCVPVSGDGQAVAVPFGLCVKEPGWQVARAIRNDLDAARVWHSDRGRCRYLPPPTAAPPTPPRLILFPSYRPGAPCALTRLAPAQTLQQLVGSRAWLARQPEALGAFLGLLEQVPAYAVDYPDLDAAVAVIRTL